jgi:hypothetical protein
MDSLRKSKKISLLAVAILFIFTFLSLILDAPRTPYLTILRAFRHSQNWSLDLKPLIGRQLKGNKTLNPVLRIWDVYPGSRILIFTHPGSRIPDLGSRIPDPKTGTKERGEKN